MTRNDATNQYAISRYVVDANGGGTYTTIQGAIDEANTVGIAATVYIRPGTYTENLTLYDTIDLWGAVGVADTGTCTIIGVHTPPATGTLTIRNIELQTATHILNSAVAGTATLIIMDAQIDITNGYVFNLPNWTGVLAYFDVGSISTEDGVVNNTAGATVFITDATIGAGTTNPMIVSGIVELFNTHVVCPLTIQGAAVATINGGSWLDNTLTTANTADIQISETRIETGATQAITHNSTTPLSISEVSINSSNNPAIGGTGTLNVGSITFEDDDHYAGTLTINEGQHLYTPELTSNNMERLNCSGFLDWAAAGPYYDDTTLGQFDLLVGGRGYINGRLITWTGPQSVNGMTAGNTYFIYIDDTGTLQLTTTRTEALFINNIVLFECLRDSTPVTNNQITVKENHPYNFQVQVSNYLHDVVGPVINNTANGANITLNGTQGIQINGTDYLEDHGLETEIPDSAAAAVTWHKKYTTAAGKWALYNTTNTFLGVYNNAGTPTALGGSKFAIYTLYASKDDLNSTTPTYFAVLDTSQYNNLTAAQTAIANGTNAIKSNELAALELAQLGHIVFSQASNSIVYVNIEKATLKSSTTTSGATTANLITTNTTNFDGILSVTDTTVQASLETIDEFGKNLTDHAVVVGNGNGLPLGVVAVGTTGQLLVGATGADPAFASTAAANFSFTSTTSGATRSLTSVHSDATGAAASHAYVGATTQSGSAGDPYLYLNVSGGQDYAFGVDNSSSDALKITDDVNPSAGNTLWNMTATGERTMPLQPAFSAYLPSIDLNVTGDATNFVMGSVTALTEIFDQNSDFVTTGTFTAPVTGRYLLSAGFYLTGGTNITGSIYYINTSNRNFRTDGTGTSVATVAIKTICILTDMDAADTATFSVTTVDAGGKINDLFGAATPFTWCGGSLVC